MNYYIVIWQPIIIILQVTPQDYKAYMSGTYITDWTKNIDLVIGQRSNNSAGECGGHVAWLVSIMVRIIKVTITTTNKHYYKSQSNW